MLGALAGIFKPTSVVESSSAIRRIAAEDLRNLAYSALRYRLPNLESVTATRRSGRCRRHPTANFQRGYSCNLVVASSRP